MGARPGRAGASTGGKAGDRRGRRRSRCRWPAGRLFLRRGCRRQPLGVSTTSASGNGAAAGSGAPAAPSSSTPAPTAAELPVIAARKASDGKTQLAVELNSVQSSGRLMTVTWSVRNNSSDDWGRQLLLLGRHLPARPEISLSSETAGAAMVLMSSTRPAPVATCRPATRKAIACAPAAPPGSRRAGCEHPAAGRLQAPPAEVSVVYVAIPHAGTFTAAPVTRT